MYYQNPYIREQVQVKQDKNIIKVYGEGTVLAKPNQATVLLGVVTDNKNLQEAQQTNAKITANVIQEMLHGGVPREQIQTSDFRIDMDYDFQNGKQVFRGYRVTNLLTITIENIDKVGEIVDIAVDNGANTVRNVEMIVSNKEIYYRQALSKAITDAQEKAAIIAKTLGTSVNQLPSTLKEIKNNVVETPRSFVLGMSTEKAATPIEAGQFQITAVVGATFQF